MAHRISAGRRNGGKSSHRQRRLLNTYYSLYLFEALEALIRENELKCSVENGSILSSYYVERGVVFVRNLDFLSHLVSHLVFHIS